MRIRRIAGCILFLLLGCVLFGQISEILRRKTAAETDMVHTFYEISENELDVVFLGSSHLYYGVQPNELWREYGITSYLMGSPEQTAATAYFLLKEVFEYQKPKVVVMDNYYLWYEGLYDGESRLRQAFDGMRFGKNKLEMLKTMLPEAGMKEVFSYIVPFMKYHARWQELEDYDFATQPFLKGARLNYHIADIEDPGVPKKKVEVPELSMEYLEKIMQLCEENGAEFVMITIPYGIEKDMKRYRNRQGMTLYLEEYLEEKGTPFLFYQKDYPELIDFKTDFRDRTHLNTPGSVKLTNHLGEWLVSQYELTDHRGDAVFASWDEDLALYDQACLQAQEYSDDNTT